MKFIKKFNESYLLSAKPSFKKYNKKQLDDLSIRDRINYDRVIDAVASGWNIERDIITAVVVAMGGSFDLSEEYLSDMDAYSYTNDPGGYWEEWCDKHDISDENPF